MFLRLHYQQTECVERGRLWVGVLCSFVNLFSRGWWIKNATFSDQVPPWMQWKVHQSEDCRKVWCFWMELCGFDRDRRVIFVNQFGRSTLFFSPDDCEKWSMYNNDHRSPLLLLALVGDVGGRKHASMGDIVCQFSGCFARCGTEQRQWESVCVSFGPERLMFGTRSALSDPQDIGGKAT